MNDQEQSLKVNKPNIKKIYNFKQLLKIQGIRKQRKVDHNDSIRQLVQYDKGSKKILCEEKLIKLPIQSSIFRQISLRQHNHYSPRKNINHLIFPSLQLKNQRKSIDSHYFLNSQHSVLSKPNLPLKLSNKNIEKIKPSSKIINREIKEQKPRILNIISPFSRLQCKSISPLSNETYLPDKRLSLGQKLHLPKFKMKTQQHSKSSVRYKDIPISQFFYDKSSSKTLEKKMEQKFEKIWKKGIKRQDQMQYDQTQ